MPIYEYRCAACGFQKEHLQKRDDPVLRVCPQCGAERYEKQLSVAGFQLKGSGWYATDFKTRGEKPAPPCPGAEQGCPAADSGACVAAAAAATPAAPASAAA
ncbi:MAG: zinc ribbon domain-containing protein [Zoogloeaceae bacterium]|jgi:putative FmdB family regulatory protein|nr:zinc ribbon domain-containing protein [Zoogloeaceae bacterium]